MVVGHVGLPGHCVLGVESQEVVPALIQLLKMVEKTVLGNTWRHLTVTTNSCST